MRELVELFDKVLKAVMTETLQKAIINRLETNGNRALSKIRKFQKKTKSRNYKQESMQILKQQQKYNN